MQSLGDIPNPPSPYLPTPYFPSIPLPSLFKTPE